jgi:nickel-dependent lactate racemase
VDLPDGARVRVVEPSYVEGLADEQAAVREAVLKPIGSNSLAELVSPGDKVGIIFSDISRPTPYQVILPPVLEIIESVKDVEIVLFNATGTHRSNTKEELDSILGPEIASRYRIVQNDCTDAASHRVVGTTSSGGLTAAAPRPRSIERQPAKSGASSVPASLADGSPAGRLPAVEAGLGFLWMPRMTSRACSSR